MPLVCKLELRPADGGRPALLGTLVIARLGPALEESSYLIRLETTTDSEVAPDMTLTSEIHGFARERGAWALVHEALGTLRIRPAR